MADWATCNECGTDFKVAVYGNRARKNWCLENWDWTCEECKAKQFEEKNKLKAEENKENGLPELTGTDKQVAWAETIRNTILENIDKLLAGEPKYLDYFSGKYKSDDPLIPEAYTALCCVTSASWWIDSRDTSYGNILTQFIKKAEEAPKSNHEKSIADAAKAEATVRPENPRTETVAEIKVTADKIQILFPEKHEDFRLLVKDYGFHWEAPFWQRNLYPVNGTPEDRAVEMGHVLLAKRFCIRIYDETIRNKAIAGEFKAEQKSWILGTNEERFKDWLSIIWSKSDDYYKAAKALPGSKYDHSTYGLYVPSVHFEEVLDFAEMYGFSISKKAQEIIDSARIIKETSLMVQVKQKKTKKPQVAEGIPVLHVPENVTVADAFKD